MVVENRISERIVAAEVHVRVVMVIEMVKTARRKQLLQQLWWQFPQMSRGDGRVVIMFRKMANFRELSKLVVLVRDPYVYVGIKARPPQTKYLAFLRRLFAPRNIPTHNTHAHQHGSHNKIFGKEVCTH
jgi:hypothetical protein